MELEQEGGDARRWCIGGPWPFALCPRSDPRLQCRSPNHPTAPPAVNKPKLREKNGIRDEWVLPFEVIPIIDIPGFGDRAAEAGMPIVTNPADRPMQAPSRVKMSPA